MTRRARLLLVAIVLLASGLPASSPLAPEPVAAADELGCTVEIIVLTGGENTTRLNCEANDDLTPVYDDTTSPAIYPPYCATGTRPFVTPRSYDKYGKVLAKNGNNQVVAGGVGYEPTSVASPLVRRAVLSAVDDQIAIAYTQAKIGAPIQPNSFYWRAIAPDLVAAYLQVERLPASIGTGGALVRRNLTERLAGIVPYDPTASRRSPYFSDTGYLAADEYGKATEFSLAGGAENLTISLASIGSPVWTLPVGKGASDLQILPTARVTFATQAAIPPTPSWSVSVVSQVKTFWRQFGLDNNPVTVRGLLSYNWADAANFNGSPFTTTNQVRAAVGKSFITESSSGRSVALPVKMMYRIESYAPVTRAVAWREYQQVWVPPTTTQVCTTVNGKTTCTTVPVAGYYKWVATGAVVGNPSATWIAAPGYPQPRGSATTQWRPVNKVVGYKIAMGPDTWAASSTALTNALRGSASSLSGILANQRYDADSPGGTTLLRRLEGAWWPIGVIPAIKNAGETTLGQVETLLNEAVMRQLGTDTNRDKRITATEGMVYGQRARWYTAVGSTITPGIANTLMLPAFRAPSVVLTGAAQTSVSVTAGERAVGICGNPVKVMDFGGSLGRLAAQPLSIAYFTGPTGGSAGVPMQRMGMVLYENNCKTSNISAATQYDRLRGFPGDPAEDSIGGACWVSWGLYRIPLPFIAVSSDLDALFNYYKVKRTGLCPGGAATCSRWTTPVLDKAAVVGKEYTIEGAPGTQVQPNPPADYLNVISTKSGFVGEPAQISASQVGISLEIGQVCRVVVSSDLVRFCNLQSDTTGRALPGRVIAKIVRNGNNIPIKIIFERTPLSRLGDPDCRSLSRADLLAKCGIGYDTKSGSYFFRVRVRTWWDGVISHSLTDWPKPLGLFSNLRFDADGSKLGNGVTNEDAFEYLRSWGAPASLGLADRYPQPLTFPSPNDAPPVTRPWYSGSGGAVATPRAPHNLTDAPLGAWSPAGWGSYWLCSPFATGPQKSLCPVEPGSPEYRRQSRPLFDGSLACNVDGGIAGLATKEDCFLDIPVVSSQPGAN